MTTKVHRVRYYNPKPQSINCVSLNKTTKHLAVARGDASIEIWDLNYAPYIVKVIPGVANGSVEALGWVHERLLSTGLGGALIEWDLDKLTLKTTVLLTGYAAWCLDVNSDSTLAAIGTEQGYVNLFSVENDEIVYRKLFDKQEGRILCCKFNSVGNVLVTGSIDTIRAWNVETGHATCRISVSRRGKEVIVWCLAVLSDNIFVSGDSLGRLTFWDGTLGDQIESYTTHKADILSLVVSDDEKSMFCSGLDPVIINFIKVNKSSATDSSADTHWVKNVQRNIHEHDVRGLVLNGEQLISIGIDGYLTLSSYPPKWVMRIPPIIPAPRSSVCARKKLLLLRFSNHLDVWKLGSCAVNENGKVTLMNVNTKEIVHNTNNNILEQDSTIALMDKANQNVNAQSQSLKLTEKPVKLVSVQTKGKKQIRCCELSPTGEFIVYSTDSDIRMLKLDAEDEQTNVSLSKLFISGIKPPCNRIAFAEDSRTMAVHCAGNIHILQVDPEAGATVIQTISTDKYFNTKSILHLIISKKSPTGVTYLVAADTQGAIAVWTHETKKFEHYVTLPTYQCVPSALTVDIERQNLIVTYVDQKIVEYGLTNKKFTQWPGAALPPEWASRRAAALAVAPHPARDALVFQDDTSLWIMDKNAEIPERAINKKCKPATRNLPFKIIPIKYLAGFHWIDKDEVVTLEVLPENIVSQLPPISASKRHCME